MVIDKTGHKTKLFNILQLCNICTKYKMYYEEDYLHFLSYLDSTEDMENVEILGNNTAVFFQA